MITITNDLSLVSFAGNPIKLSVNSDNTLDSGYGLRKFYTIFCEIFTEEPQTGYEIPIYTESLEPDSQGNVTFDISKLIRNLITASFQYPQSEDNLVYKDTGAVCQFWIQLGDGYGIIFERQPMQSYEGPYYAIPGGLSDWVLEEIEGEEGNTFTFLQENKMFLTNQPESKRVRTGQPEYLRFFNCNSISQDITLKLKEYNLDGEVTNTDILSSTLEEFSLYSFDVTPGIAFTLQEDTDSWEIWLESDSIAISEVMSYRLDEQREPRSRFFIFQNSLGGFDTVAATGKRKLSVEAETTINLLPISTNFRSAYSINQDRPLCKELYKGFIGLFSEIETQWLQEFFRSEKRYLKGDIRLESVGLKTTSFQLFSDDPVPTEVEIEAYIGVPDFFFSRLRTERIKVIPKPIIYGALYNCYAVKDSRGLSPEGWHVATKEEWLELIDLLGGTQIAGGKLKFFGNYWNSPNTGASNQILFNGKASGQRTSDGYYNNFGSMAYFWTSTSGDFFGSNFSYALKYDSSVIYIPFRENSQNTGYSVRLVKDDSYNPQKFTDIDGNVYTTIKIGEKVWLSENLKVKHYSNGDIIPEINNSNDWALLNSGAWCAPNNDLNNI